MTKPSMQEGLEAFHEINDLTTVTSVAAYANGWSLDYIKSVMRRIYGRLNSKTAKQITLKAIEAPEPIVSLQKSIDELFHQLGE